MDELGDLGWVAHRSYELEGYIFGVRTNSDAFCAWLDNALADHRIPDKEADPNFSVLIGEPGKVGKSYHILYKDSTSLMRTFDLPALGRALLSEIEAVSFPRRDDAIYMQYALVSARGTKALIPAELVSFFDQVARKVDRAGVTLPVTAFTAVDLESGELIPTPRTLGLDEEAAEPLARIASADGWPARATLDRPANVDVICGMGYLREVAFAPISRGVALFTLTAFTKNLPVLRQSGLEGLRRLIEGVPCYQLTAEHHDEMLESLLTVLSGQAGDAATVAT